MLKNTLKPNAMVNVWLNIILIVDKNESTVKGILKRFSQERTQYISTHFYLTNK